MKLALYLGELKRNVSDEGTKLLFVSEFMN